VKRDVEAVFHADERCMTTPPIRRRPTPQSGRALEVLGHAIEYLADEYAVDPGSKGPLGNLDPRIEAIQLLKRLNRQIYLSCAEVPPPLTRVRRWLLGTR
jgi:hypothetical protein